MLEELAADESEECTNPLIKAPKEEKRAERVSQDLGVSRQHMTPSWDPFLPLMEMKNGMELALSWS